MCAISHDFYALNYCEIDPFLRLLETMHSQTCNPDSGSTFSSYNFPFENLDNTIRGYPYIVFYF